MRKEIEKLAEALAEKRSDISDILYSILDGQELDEDWIEHRFIITNIPEGATDVEYDTLTTMFSFKIEGVWESHIHKHIYEN